MKSIMIKKGVTKEVSFEEILKLNKGLMGLYIKKWYTKFEYEDLYQLCSMALWKAYTDYDIEKGFCFSTLANRYIFNIISGEFRTGARHHVIGDSLEKEIAEGVTLGSRISCSKDFVKEFETDLYVGQILDEREKIVLKLLSENYTQKQIAKALETSQMNISRVLKKIRTKFREEGYQVA